MQRGDKIKYIFIICLLAAVIYPLTNIYFIYPSFRNLLLEEMEENAVQLTNHLSPHFVDENKNLEFRSGLHLEITKLRKNFKFEKIKLFAADGRVAYSTDKDDIGTINQHAYFYNTVAKGKSFSKVVHKGNRTLENRRVAVDVLETYVPVMQNLKFMGAIEIYYDITEKRHKLDRVASRVTMLPLILMGIFLLATVTILIRIDSSDLTIKSLRRPPHLQSPFYFIFFTILSIFSAEFLIMLFLRNMHAINLSTAILDSVLLVLLAAPGIYFFLGRPLLMYIFQLKQADAELLKAHETMEENVEQRTAELKEALTGLELEISERQLTEKELFSSQLRFKTIFENSATGITLSDVEGHPLQANPAFETMLGYSTAELQSMTFADITHPEDVGHHTESYNDLLAGRLSHLHMRKRYIHKDGHTVWGQLTLSTVRDEENKPTHIVGMVEDIGVRKQLEEERIKSSKLESIGILAGGIAHNFNNILTAILGNVSIAKISVEKGSKVFERLTATETATLRAKSLTQQLLTFSKGGQPVKKILSIQKQLEESVDFSLAGSNVRCQLDLPGDIWPVEADEGQLGQVFQNVLTNANHAMAEGGTLHIRAENLTLTAKSGAPPPGQYVKVSFQDQGCGIAPEIMGQIFDPYFTTKKSGSGLGLASCHSIITAHGGHIEISSVPGEGTTVTIYLQASPNAQMDWQSTPPEMPATGGKILLMDDEAMIRDFTGELLNESGYEVALAKDGAEALELYTKAMASGQPFDAVILDLTVPGGMGGAETIKKLLEIDPGVTAIASSGYAQDPIMANYMEYGFKYVVPKPYQVDDIRTALHRIMGR